VLKRLGGQTFNTGMDHSWSTHMRLRHDHLHTRSWWHLAPYLNHTTALGPTQCY